MQTNGYSPRSSAGGRSSRHSTGTSPTVYSPENARKPAANQQHVSQQISGQSVGASSTMMAGGHASPVGHSQMPSYMNRQLVVVGYDYRSTMDIVNDMMKKYPAFYKAVPVQKSRPDVEPFAMRLKFDDVRAVVDALYHLQAAGLYARFVDHSEDFGVDLSEAKAIVTVAGPRQTNDRDVQQIARHVLSIASMFGEVRSCDQGVRFGCQWNFVVEFFSSDIANRFVYGFDGLPAGNRSFILSGSSLVFHVQKVQLMRDRVAKSLATQNTIWATGSTPVVGHRSAQRDHHDKNNSVARDRIVNGLDVRTTIMLRNIPNQMDWMSLKEVLDCVCIGTYDFVYLRIDFSSGCNVGYAFVNFTDVAGILCLVDKVENRPWRGYRSGKCAEISYATIQGREALVQKFRNSSVMMEAPYCRPRKMKRSIENARTVGLYAPHGSHNGHGHRDRTSMYDRGTPRDMMMNQANQLHDPVYDEVPQWVKDHLVKMFNNGPFFAHPFTWSMLPNDFLRAELVRPSNGYSYQYQQPPRMTFGAIGAPVTNGVAYPVHGPARNGHIGNGHHPRHCYTNYGMH